MAQGAAVDPRDRARRGAVRLGGVTPQHPVPGVVVPSEGVAHPEEIVERGRGHPQAMAARQVAGQREFHPPASHQQQIRGDDLLREEIAHAPSSRQPPRQALRRDLIAVIAFDGLGDRHRAPRRVRELMDEARDGPVWVVGVMEHPNVAALPVVLTGDARVHGRVEHMERAERYPLVARAPPQGRDVRRDGQATIVLPHRPFHAQRHLQVHSHTRPSLLPQYPRSFIRAVFYVN